MGSGLDTLVQSGASHTLAPGATAPLAPPKAGPDYESRVSNVGVLPYMGTVYLFLYFICSIYIPPLASQLSTSIGASALLD